jgi:hypothetical protein
MRKLLSITMAIFVVSLEAHAQPSAEQICSTLAQAASENDLPVEFFTRLIWQESRFDPAAVSSKGALGIAQFMPGTASERGLADPLEPLQALRESASYLRELRTTFGGNLGLAAAAYNAGPGRVEGWLAGRRGLPSETRAYVLIVTGHRAEAWASRAPPQWAALEIPKGALCMDVAKSIATPPRRPEVAASNPAWGPWGIQLAGNWSEGKVLASYEQLRRQYRSVLLDRLPLCCRDVRRACAESQSTSSAYRKAAARRRMRCARGCGQRAGPASSSATPPVDEPSAKWAKLYGRRAVRHGART